MVSSSPNSLQVEKLAHAGPVPYASWHDGSSQKQGCGATDVELSLLPLDDGELLLDPEEWLADDLDSEDADETDELDSDDDEELSSIPSLSSTAPSFSTEKNRPLKLRE